MDLVKEAIFLGFSGAAVMDTTQLVFVPEYRMFCEENLCGCYNVNPACPPESGTVEEMKQRALQYEKTLVLQTMQEVTDRQGAPEAPPIRAFDEIVKREPYPVETVLKSVKMMQGCLK